MRISVRVQFVVLVLLVLCAGCFGALRIATYNIANGVIRTGLDTVLEAIGAENVNGIERPVDILALQEQSSPSTTTESIRGILNTIYQTNVYQRSTTSPSGAGGMSTVVYNSSTVVLLDEEEITNGPGPRNFMRFTFRPVGYTSPEAIFYVYVFHLKASSSSSSTRTQEAAVLRASADALGEGANIIYTGDFNLYSSSEGAWTNFTAAGNGQAFDPVNQVGGWHDSSAFKRWHTQAPAVSPPSGLVGSGMDDRFDFQLVTGELMDGNGVSVITSSYHTFGNNGTHSLNGNISSGSGASSTVLNAMMTATDHCPVVADYQVPAVMDLSVSEIPSPGVICQGYPLEVFVTNTAQTQTVEGADELIYFLDSSVYASGGGGGGEDPFADWMETDIGSTGIAGSYQYNSQDEQLIIHGAGSITSSSDNFHFLYDDLTGDGELVYRVANFSATDLNATVGLMIREGTGTDARYGYIYLRNSGDILWRTRYITGFSSIATQGGMHLGSRYLKITRSGNTITGYESIDGNSWTQVDSIDLFDLAATLQVGFAVSSGTTVDTCQATFGEDGSSGTLGPYTADPLAASNVHYLAVNAAQTGYQTAQVSANSTSEGVQNGFLSENVSFRYTDIEDFDGDYDFDLDDINLLLGAIYAGSGDAIFDVDGSLSVDRSDLTFVLETIMDVPYGDFDLDRDVDDADLTILLDNWLTPGAQWQHGEMTGNNVVDFQDFSLFVVNRQGD